MKDFSTKSKNKTMYFAYHDNLTGLSNRIFFGKRLSQAVAKADRIVSNIALFSMDLDRFKAINDTQGHNVGDRLLKSVAKRLNQLLG